MNNKTIITIAVAAIAAIAILVLSRGGGTPAVSAEIKVLAQCLADKKITMYGADWCSHCAAEKARFGEYFKLVPYIECPENTKLCIDKGIEGYPTWILPDGTKLAGEQGLEGIARASGCSFGDVKTIPPAGISTTTGNFMTATTTR